VVVVEPRSCSFTPVSEYKLGEVGASQFAAGQVVSPQSLDMKQVVLSLSSLSPTWSRSQDVVLNWSMDEIPLITPGCTGEGEDRGRSVVMRH